MPSSKFAVTVRAELLTRVERLRRGTGESRSAVVARALARLLEDELRAENVRRYQQAYREHPESTEDVQEARALAALSLRHAPSWDDS